MIRFIDLGTQISSEREFTFYHTITDTFVTVDGEQTWHSKRDLESSFSPHDHIHSDHEDRLLDLIPESWPDA